MIPADGYVVVFTVGQGSKTRQEMAQVIAWDEEGRPLVVWRSGLILAENLGTWHGAHVQAWMVERISHTPVTFLPGGGWMGTFKDGENSWSTPVVAWSIDSDGHGAPLFATSDGSVMPDCDEPHVWHPDEIGLDRPT